MQRQQCMCCYNIRKPNIVYFDMFFGKGFVDTINICSGKTSSSLYLTFRKKYMGKRLSLFIMIILNLKDIRYNNIYHVGLILNVSLWSWYNIYYLNWFTSIQKILVSFKKKLHLVLLVFSLGSWINTLNPKMKRLHVGVKGEYSRCMWGKNIPSK